MKIKNILEIIIEKITFRNCNKCKYNNMIICTRNDKKGNDCRNSIFPCGFKKK